MINYFFTWPYDYINPILTVWEGITGKYKPEDESTSPTEGRACAKSEGLYFPVMHDQTVSIGFITRIYKTKFLNLSLNLLTATLFLSKNAKSDFNIYLFYQWSLTLDILCSELVIRSTACVMLDDTGKTNILFSQKYLPRDDIF